MTPNDIKQKALKHYPQFLRCWLQQTPFEPIVYRISPPSLEYAVILAHQETWKNTPKYYHIEWTPKNTRAHGTQTIAETVMIENQEDYLALIEKTKEWQKAVIDLELIKQELPTLLPLLEQKPLLLIEHHSLWHELILVCQYFLAHPRPNIFARELPIAVHSKFIEQHQPALQQLLNAILPPKQIDVTAKDFEARFGLKTDEALIRFRFLDLKLQQKLNFPVTDCSTPHSSFAALQWQGLQCLIVENKKTFLTLPQLEHTLAIWGGGKAASLLAEAKWLNTCSLYYAGDIDSHGFEILSSLRTHFPHIKSVLMDISTFEKFPTFVVEGNTLKNTQHLHLHPDEVEIFWRVQNQGLLLEQERIDHVYLKTQLLQLEW